MKKKILAALVCAAMTLSLAGCGNDETPAVTSEPTSKTEGTLSTGENKPEGSSSTPQDGSSEPTSKTYGTSTAGESKPESSSGEPTSSSTASNPAPQLTGSVTIWGKDYDIATTTKLDLSYQRITNEQWNEIVPEIAKLTNLTELWLDGNQISDITPLAKFTYLTLLSLGENQISDITPLANLTNLTVLYLYGNQISDITPLASLTSLTELHLYANQISDEDMERLKTQFPNCKIY